MKFVGVAQLGMAPRLMMNHKSGTQERAQNFSWLQDRKVRCHLGGESYAKLAFESKPLVRNGLSGFPQSLDMAFDGISRHLLGLCQGTPIRHKPRQKRNCHLISRFRLRIFPKRSASLCRFSAPNAASVAPVHRQVNNSES